MHEIGLMEQTLAIALDYAHRDRAHRIEQIAMRVGVLSGVEPEALRFAFEILAQNTIAETAQLQIMSIPTRCYCHFCQIEFEPMGLGYECPQCQRWSTAILQGKELELASLEVS